MMKMNIFAIASIFFILLQLSFAKKLVRVSMGMPASSFTSPIMGGVMGGVGTQLAPESMLSNMSPLFSMGTTIMNNAAAPQ